MTLERSPAPAGVHLCGRLVVEIDGRAREDVARGRQGRLLLAYLVLNRRAAVSRDQLIDAVWGDQLPPGAAGVLSTLLSQLRRALGEGRIEGRRELRLDLGPDAYVDVEAAVAARDRAFDALARSAYEEALEAAELAARISEQDVLPGHDADWLEAVRADMRDVRADALEVVARAALALSGDRVSAATSAAAALVKLTPFRESGYGLLMEAHAARGNVAEGLRVFEELRTLLRDELGMTPAPFLIELHERLLKQGLEPAEGPPPAPARLALPAPLERSAGFVGRAPALGRLRDLLTEAAGGRRRLAVVAGEPGIGKTTLATRLAQDAHAGGAVVLYGRSDEDTVLAYQPFVEALVHYVSGSPPEALEPAANPDLAELARLLPDAGLALRGANQPPPSDPEAERFRMFEAMVAVLDRIAAGRTLVFVIDDLHWADRSTLRLLRHLSRASRPARLLLVATYRDVEVEPHHAFAGMLADLRREGALEDLSLDGLDAEETRALIAARGGPDSAAIAGRLRELTAGNPFFLEEVLRSVPGDGAALDETALAEIRASEGVKQMIARRLARLDPRASELLSLAAVLGIVFRLPVVEELAGPERESVLSVLEQAVGARLVVEVPSRPETFGFAHALVRETLYEGMTRSRRARLHRRAGEALEAHRAELGVLPGELAHHFLETGVPACAEKAVSYAREAAASAIESLAYDEAAELLERALATGQAAGDEEQRCELLLALGEARTRAGNPAAREAFAGAAALARDRWPERLARAAIGFGGRYYEAGVIDAELIALLEEALSALPESDGRLRTRVLGRLAEALHFAGRVERSLSLSEQAVAAARRLDDPETLAGALDGRHIALLHIEHLDERIAVADELYELAHGLRQPELTVQALQHRLFDLLEAGDLRAARRAHDELKRLAAELRQPLFRSYAITWSGVWALMDGRFDETERLAGEFLDLQRRLGARDAETAFGARMLAVRREQGRLAELAPVVEQLMVEFPALAPWRSALPMVYAEAGDHDRARAALHDFAAGLDELPRDFFWLTAMTGAAEAAATLGDQAVAARLPALLAPYAGRTVQIGPLANFGPVDRLLGLLAATAGDHARAREHLEQALALGRRLGARTVTIRIESELGELLAVADGREDRDRASELLERALLGARELGMAGVASRCERLLTAAAA